MKESLGPLERIGGLMPNAHKVFPWPKLALAQVLSKDGQSIYASSDTLYKGAVFGRDSLEVADDLIHKEPQLVHNILLTMGRLQGCSDRIENEEEPGKIIHEYRNIMVDGKRIKGRQLEIFRKLSAAWGGTDTELAYYGSVDATPLFLRVLGKYCDAQGRNILREQVTRRDGTTVPLEKVAAAATTWLLNKLTAAKSGLIEYQKRNPRSFSNQVWKDSEEFYVHTNGEMANHNRPIASIEVQGLAYDALLAAARIFPPNAGRYTSRARQLRDTVLNLLWDSEENYFALGTDYTSGGQQRLIRTRTANPAELLDTGFFDDLSDADRQKYVGAIIKSIMAADFLTSAGIRSRSLRAADVVPTWDYHGSFVTWPKETYDIAKGLRRQGFPALGRQLENRLLNLVRKTRDYPEFAYVDRQGRVLAGAPSSQEHGSIVEVHGPNTPERLQAWTASAVYAITSGAGNGHAQARQEAWQADLEAEIMAGIQRMKAYTPFTHWLFYPTHRYRLTAQPRS